MEIYAEVLFLINFSALFLCLLPAVKTFNIKTPRHIFSAVVGAIWALVAFAAGFNDMPAKAFIIAGYIFTAFIAFGRRLKAVIMFFTMLFLTYAVTAVTISFLGDGNNAFIKNGVIYFNIPLRVFVPALMLSFPVVTAAERVWRSAFRSKLHALKIKKSGHSVNVTALHDSGNLLTEPISGRPVILVSRAALSQLDINKIITEEKPLIIPYRSFGHNGAVLGFSADEIILDNKKEISEAVIGISDEKFAYNCDALIGGI